MHREKPQAPLQPNEIPSYPWEHISIDIIGELPESQGYNAILVIVMWVGVLCKLGNVPSIIRVQHPRGPRLEATHTSMRYEIQGEGDNHHEVSRLAS
jgi:hypothetical protein